QREADARADADPAEGRASAEWVPRAAQYAAIRRHLPEDLATAADVGYVLGWRVQSEILTLERRHVDLEGGTLRLDAARAKNRTGRVVYIPATSARRCVPNSAAYGRLRRRPARSFLTCSRSCRARAGSAFVDAISARRGQQRARPPACPAR